MTRYLGALLALIALAHATQPEAPEPLPVEYFLAPPIYRLPKLSPDGRRYAIVVAKDAFDLLVTVDLTTGKSAPITKADDAKLVNYWWKSSDLLLLLLEDRLGFREFHTYDLKTGKSDRSGDLRSNWIFLLNPLVDDPENVLISTNEKMGMNLRKFNVRTGYSVPVQSNSSTMVYWYTNKKGEAIAALGCFHKAWFMSFPAQLGQPWRRVELDKRNPSDFWPITVAPDQHRILGFDSGSTDTSRIIAWDPSNDSKETVWESKEVDPDAFVPWGDDWTRTIAIVYETDRPRAHYLDPEDQELAAVFDGALPDTTNTILSTSADKSRMIIKCESDKIASDFYLFDRKAKRIAKLGSAYARSEPTRMSPSRYFTCKARDGLTLHGRIYLPLGNPGPHPAVLISSNLHERSRLGYIPFLQLLASRGYAAVTIDHRGTQGYGSKFYEAGNGQISSGMPDDLIDGLDWLAKEGLIDRERVAIMGENLGGLLAVQTLARHPGRFSAWINLWTPMDMDELDANTLVFGRYSDDEITERFGSESAREKNLRTIDPINFLPRITTPSFHYYPRNSDNSLVFSGDRLAKHIAKGNQFIKGGVVRDSTEFRHNRERIFREDSNKTYIQLLNFLGEHLQQRK